MSAVGSSSGLLHSATRVQHFGRSWRLSLCAKHDVGVCELQQTGLTWSSSRVGLGTWSIVACAAMRRMWLNRLLHTVGFVNPGVLAMASGMMGSLCRTIGVVASRLGSRLCLAALLSRLGTASVFIGWAHVIPMCRPATGQALDADVKPTPWSRWGGSGIRCGRMTNYVFASLEIRRVVFCCANGRPKHLFCHSERSHH